MYAIIETGGKQYKVQEGDVIVVEKLDAAEGEQVTFDKVLADRLNVMDATAIVMCRDNRLPLQVFNLNNSGDLTRLVRGEDVGTIVTYE